MEEDVLTAVTVSLGPIIVRVKLDREVLLGDLQSPKSDASQEPATA